MQFCYVFFFKFSLVFVEYASITIEESKINSLRIVCLCHFLFEKIGVIIVSLRSNGTEKIRFILMLIYPNNPAAVTHLFSNSKRVSTVSM